MELETEEWVLRVISPEDLIVDRLAAWKFWRSEIDGVNAYRLWKAQVGQLEVDRLKERARKEHVADALRELEAFVVGPHRAEPDDEEVARWARRGR